MFSDLWVEDYDRVYDKSEITLIAPKPMIRSKNDYVFQKEKKSREVNRPASELSNLAYAYLIHAHEKIATSSDYEERRKNGIRFDILASCSMH